MRSHLGMADVQGDVYYIYVRKDYIHKLTDEIARDYAEVVVPRPNFADVVERVDGSALVNDAAWGELVRQLECKCRWRDRAFREADGYLLGGLPVGHHTP